MTPLTQKVQLYGRHQANDYYPLPITYTVFVHKFEVGPWLDENIGDIGLDWNNKMFDGEPFLIFNTEADMNLFKLVWDHLLNPRPHLDWN